MENIEYNEKDEHLPKSIVVWLLVLALISIALAWGLPASFDPSNNRWIYNNRVDFGLYLALKIFFLVYIIGWTTYWLFFAKRRPKPISGMMLGATIVGQGIPGLMRLGQFMPGFDPGWAILVFIIPVVIYICLIIFSLVYSFWGEDYEGKLKGRVEPIKKHVHSSELWDQKNEPKKEKAKKIEIEE